MSAGPASASGRITSASSVTLYPKAAYNLLKDFTFVSVVAAGANALLVHPSLPVKSVAELVTLARAKPKAIRYGSAGTGSITHLTGELFKKLGGGLDIVHIPYKGAGPGLQDLVAGHIPMYKPAISPAPPG